MEAKTKRKEKCGSKIKRKEKYHSKKKLEAKRSKKKILGSEKKKNWCEIFDKTGKTEVKRILFRLVSLWSKEKFEAKPAHPKHTQFPDLQDDGDC